MRLIVDQPTLAKTVASVFFYILLAPAQAQPDPAAGLAQALYHEGDWQHARIEALRYQYVADTNAALLHAIVHLAALQINPGDTDAFDALQGWLITHTNHTEHAWVADQRKQATLRPKKRRIGLTARIARVIVGFYQRQIGPAIGQRCAMHPSCSHYSLEACQRYGLAGIPMTADRLIRESDHIRFRINPIQLQDREVYLDPVSDHAHWFRRYHK